MVHDPTRGDGEKPLPRTRSGRIPQWKIDESLGLPPRYPSPWREASPMDLDVHLGRGRDGQPPGHQSWPPPSHRKRGRLRRALNVMGAIVLLASGGAWAFYRGVNQHTASNPTPPVIVTRAVPNGPAPAVQPSTGHVQVTFADQADVWFAHVGRPTPSVESAVRLGTPAPVTVTSDSFRFLGGGRSSSGQVAAYDPCRPIHYVISDGAPDGADRLVKAAIGRTSKATGLKFVDDGATDEAPSERRNAFQPNRYGDRWAPVLIAWTTPTQVPDLKGDVVGTGGSAAVAVSGRAPVYVSGQVALDAPQIAQVLTRPRGNAIVQGIIEHELGHLVGLDHVDDPTQLMFPVTTPGVTDFAAGDLTGLSILGQGRCAPEL